MSGPKVPPPGAPAEMPGYEEESSGVLPQPRRKRRLKLPSRLKATLKGESEFSDGTSNLRRDVSVKVVEPGQRAAPIVGGKQTLGWTDDEPEKK